MDAGGCGGVDELDGRLEAAAVVVAELCYHISRFAVADFPVSELEFRYHVWTPFAMLADVGYGYNTG